VSGKSNFIRLLAALADGRLQTFVQQQGGPDALLVGSRKRSSQLDAEIYFEKRDGIANGYWISLLPTADNRLIFGREESWIDGHYAERACQQICPVNDAKLAAISLS
jgi:predicted ATPase